MRISVYNIKGFKGYPPHFEQEPCEENAFRPISTESESAQNI